MNCPNRKQIVTWLLKMVKTLTIGGFEWTLPHWSVRGLVYIRAIDWFLVIFVREGTEVRSTDYRTMLTLVRAGISRGIKLYVFKNISNKMELSLILSTWETVFDYWLVKAGFHDSTCCIQLSYTAFVTCFSCPHDKTYICILLVFFKENETPLWTNTVFVDIDDVYFRYILMTA